MVLTNKQEIGLKTIVERYKNHEKYTVISGYAGSGKSSLVKFAIDALGVSPDDVAYVAFTGKAAEVLRSKGCPNATTAHKLLYFPRYNKKTNKYTFTLKRPEKPYKILVCDEVSMLPLRMWNDLLLQDSYIIALGDPGQLPPVNPAESNNILDHPHVFLDEIVRQALDNEIVRLSMHIRQGNSLQSYNCSDKDVKIFTREDLSWGMLKWSDQILSATNETRKYINDQYRKFLNMSEYPERGDKIISLRNHWDFLSENCNPLTNGCILTIDQIQDLNFTIPRELRKKSGGVSSIPAFKATLSSPESGVFNSCDIDKTFIKNGTKVLLPAQEYDLSKTLQLPMEFDYGYCISVHKAQGSSWEKVLLIEERFPFSREEHIRWLYTGITRAEKKLVIISK